MAYEDHVYRTFTLTIADGQTVSNIVDFGSDIPMRLDIPAGFDGTALTLVTGLTATTTAAVYDEDGQVDLTAAAGASRTIIIPEGHKLGPFFGIVAGAQTGAISITLVTRNWKDR